jgi:acyl dehydratase
MMSTPPTIDSGARMTTLTFDDLTPGRVFELGTTVVDRDEMVAFARRFDPQPFHVDEDAAKASLFGGLAASGWFTAGLWMRLYVDEVLNNAASLGSPGGEEVAWPAPVFAGDELRASMEILDARISRTRPGLGLVRLRALMHRGDDVVFRSTFTGMFGTRDQPSERPA